MATTWPRPRATKGRALGFVMTIFQKIAASSFAAVEATLRRRLLSLTIHEAIACDENLDPDGRDRALNEARALTRDMFGLAATPSAGRKQIVTWPMRRSNCCENWGNQCLPTGWTAKWRPLPTRNQPRHCFGGVAGRARRILDSAGVDSPADESKTLELLRALSDLWAVHPGEKIVVFTTYLGSVDALQAADDRQFPRRGR